MKKQLTKSTKYKALAGVLGGVAEYYDTDPVLVRLGYLALTLVTGVGPGILLYLIAILVIPDAPVAPAEPVAAPVRDAAPEPAQPAHDAEAV
jgi:phage shock protein PspC (stress-responsive transcriptional regulator)